MTSLLIYTFVIFSDCFELTTPLMNQTSCPETKLLETASKWQMSTGAQALLSLGLSVNLRFGRFNQQNHPRVKNNTANCDVII